MKKRTLKLTILTLTVVSVLSSGITVFAKPTNVQKNNGSSNQQINKVDQVNKTDKTDKNAQKTSKRLEKEISIISRRLDNIEISFNNVVKKMDAYINTTTSAAIDSGLNTTTSSAIDSNSNTITTNAIDSSSTTTDSSLNTADSQDLSQDFENEYKEEDNGRYNSFYGKLNAINNRLNTVERQVNKINDSDNLELAKLKTRVTSLREKVKTSMDKIGKEQKKNVDKIKAKTDRKQMKEQKISKDKKSWKISFTKGLKAETVNTENIMIVDSNSNLIDSDISYDKSTNSVVVEAKDGFNSGETYSILIGDEVQSVEGKKLAQPVEKEFTVN